MPDTRTASDIERVLRDAGPAALGVLLRQGNRFADAEDAVQDALIIAVDSWPARGMPDRPVGWVVRVAQRRLIDRHHRDTARRRREALAVSWSTMPIEPTVSEDDSLALLFLCCHAALKPSAAIPLALRAVGGLTTSEIARRPVAFDRRAPRRANCGERRARPARSAGPATVEPADDRRASPLAHLCAHSSHDGRVPNAGCDCRRARSGHRRTPPRIGASSERFTTCSPSATTIRS
jgi:DNA-directed RNA polymerase specialized sigma24 family protein